MTPTMVGLRVAASVLSAFDFGIFAVALIVFLNRTDIGHRTFIRLLAIFCSMVSCDSMFGAWSVYHHHAGTFTLMRFGTSIFGSAVVTYFIVKNRDIIRTLRISELWDRMRHDRLDNGKQARMNLNFASNQTLLQSREILMGRGKI